MCDATWVVGEWREGDKEREGERRERERVRRGE